MFQASPWITYESPTSKSHPPQPTDNDSEMDAPQISTLHDDETTRARYQTPPQRERASSASSFPRTKQKWARNSSRSMARRARRPPPRKSMRRTNRTRTKNLFHLSL